MKECLYTLVDVKRAIENNVTLITPKEMQIINDKRAKEKNK